MPCACPHPALFAPTRPVQITYASTKGGLKVTTFIKPSWVDVYANIIATFYKADVYAQTWMGGE